MTVRGKMPTLVVAVLALVGCGSAPRADSPAVEAPRTTLVPATEAEPRVRLPVGSPSTRLTVRDLRKGFGVKARRGDELITRFVAYYVTGERFESSWDEGRKPFSFRLGADESSPGWERGLRGMRVGGRRELVIPPDETSRFGAQPGSTPDDTLVYVVDLIGIRPPELEGRSEPRVQPPESRPPKDLEVRRVAVGTGPAAEVGDTLTIEYVGVRYDGRPFGSSWERAKPFRFQLGAGSVTVNPGLERGLRGMRVGERRELIIPPKLFYGGERSGDARPADTLVYVVDLIGLTEQGVPWPDR